MVKAKIFKSKAYAKINLFLNVLGKTNENMHKLKSLVCFINLYDEIVISENNKFSISIKGPFKKLIKKKNIIEKTFSIYSNFLNIKNNYKISLNKKIPVSAGLGGGSADAAIVLKGLNYLNNNKIKQKDLFSIAAQIGSDVPACLYNKNVFFSGYGEILKKSPRIPKFFLLLINPRKELSTKKIFEMFKEKQKSNKKNIFNYKNFFPWAAKQNNDLQKYSEKVMPDIRKMLFFLNSLDTCFFSRMTGSGPTVFCLFKRRIDAEKAFHLLKKQNSNWWAGVYSIKT